MLDYSRINAELEEIQAFAESDTDSNDVNLVVERGEILRQYIARTGNLLAILKKDLNEQMRSEIIETLRTHAKAAGATPKAINILVDSACSDIRFYVNWCDRLNKACTHGLDWSRSLLSKAKVEMSIGING